MAADCCIIEEKNKEAALIRASLNLREENT